MNANRPPSVDALARSLQSSGLPHSLCVEVARAAIAADRVDDAPQLAADRQRQMLIPVINATGTLLHTNLGRAPLAINSPARYANVELDLSTGQRGSRQRTVGDLIAATCGAEAAIVTNNCSAALLLVLAALAPARGAAVSRGELVEIGGAFRVPDVMRQSGAQLVEVGTTNRTRLADFQQAAAVTDLALVLSVHQSNYRISGFSEQTSISQLATLGLPVIADIGSGLLDASCPWLTGPPPTWLSDEPAARQTLDAGADIVLFSGDKLMGGPQAGIIAGRADLVAACARHPLARALRPGGLVLEALQATALHYLHRNGDAIPFWRMAALPVPAIRQRAQTVVNTVGHNRLRSEDTAAVPGGGTLPGRTIPSAGIRIDGDLSISLRGVTPTPVIARVKEGDTFLDLRTVDPSDDTNQVMSLLETSGNAPDVEDGYFTLPNPLLDGAVGTLYFRFHATDPASHVNFGLSDVVAPTGEWNHFEAQIRDNQIGCIFKAQSTCVLSSHSNRIQRLDCFINSLGDRQLSVDDGELVVVEISFSCDE